MASISCPHPNVFLFKWRDIASYSFLMLLDFFVYELSLFKGDFYPYRSCKYFSIPASLAYNNALNWYNDFSICSRYGLWELKRSKNVENNSIIVVLSTEDS